VAGIEIEIDDEAFMKEARKLLQKSENTNGLMKNIAAEMFSITEESFQNERSPDGVAWTDLSPVTKVDKNKKGYGNQRKLVREGNYFESITQKHSSKEAAVGSNAPQAGLLHFGGKAGVNKKVSVPARPHFGFGEDGKSRIQKVMENWFEIN